MKLREKLPSEDRTATWEELKGELDKHEIHGQELVKECEEKSANALDPFEIYDIAQNASKWAKGIGETLDAFLEENPFSKDISENSKGSERLKRMPQKATSAIQGTPDQREVENVRKEIIEHVTGLLHDLKVYRAILSISEVVTDPESDKVKERPKLGTAEKERLFLEKLWELSNEVEEEVSADWIAQGAGLGMDKREVREMCESLESQGLISNPSSKLGSFARITHDGKKEVESPSQEDKSASSAEIEELKKRLEDLKKELKEELSEQKEREEFTRYGQEVLFNKLDEVHGVVDSLERETLLSMVKGIFEDLVESEEVDNGLLKDYWDKLMHHLPELPTGSFPGS